MVVFYGPAGARVCAQLFPLYKLFLLVLVYKVTPHLSNGTALSGFLSMNSSILKFSSVLHTKVQSDKLSNTFIKPLVSDKVSVMSSVPISASFRSPDLLRTCLLIGE